MFNSGARIIVRSALLAFVCFGTAACATQYQSIGLAGGYEETQLDENIWMVNFRGNGFTGQQRAIDFGLLRSAELNDANGYDYFVIVQADTHISTSTYTTPTYTTSTGQVNIYGNGAYGTAQSITTGGQTYETDKPRVSFVVMGFQERPDIEATVFSSEYLVESIRSKYGIHDSNTTQ